MATVEVQAASTALPEINKTEELNDAQKEIAVEEELAALTTETVAAESKEPASDASPQEAEAQEVEVPAESETKEVVEEAKPEEEEPVTEKKEEVPQEVAQEPIVEEIPEIKDSGEAPAAPAEEKTSQEEKPVVEESKVEEESVPKVVEETPAEKSDE